MRDKAARSLVHKYRISSEQAQDVVVEAAANLIKRRAIPRNIESFLLATARNVLMTDLRRSAQTRSLFAVAEPTELKAGIEEWAVADEQADPAVQVEVQDTRDFDLARVKRALESLPEVDRTLLNAYHFEKRPLATLDETLGLAGGGARVKAHRARNRMRSVLQNPQARSKDVQ